MSVSLTERVFTEICNDNQSRSDANCPDTVEPVQSHP